MQLRDYQQNAVDKIKRKLFATVNRQIVRHATGLGKAVIIACLPEQLEFTKRMMVMTNRQGLVNQLAGTMKVWNPSRSVGIEMGPQRSDGEDIVVASIQSIGQDGSPRLAQFNPADFDAVIVDECQHSSGKTYGNVLKHFRVNEDKHRLCLGLSAHINRSDGKGLGEIFEEIVDDRDILFGIRTGWLSDLKGIRVKTQNNLDGIHNQAGDFNQQELSKEVDTPVRNDLVVRAWLEHGQDRQTLVYGVDIQHSKNLALAFKNYGISAEAIWGVDPDRDQKLAFHKARTLKVLCNCEILTEGYDDWQIGCIVIARPTQSEGLYTQIIGRSTRIPPGIGSLIEARAAGVKIEKEDAIIIDVVDNSTKHSLVSLPSLYGMDQEMDLHGRSLIEVVDEVEAIKKIKPYIDLTKVKDINKLQNYVEEVDLFKVGFSPEVLQFSDYQWHRTGVDSYVLLLTEGESVVILSDNIGVWHVTGTANGNEIEFSCHTFEEAIKEADYLVKLHGGRNLVSLIRRFSKWHNDEPSPSQLMMCKWNHLKVPTGATKGEVAMKLNWVIGERQRKQKAQKNAAWFASLPAA